jgi:hypothetical protein
MFEAIQAVAAVATFLAACVAVWATFRAPKVAAEFAEALRTATSRADEQRRQKLFIFATLLENRAHIVAPACVSALNLIDLVFIDDREVRDALVHFRSSTDGPASNAERTVERYLFIIEKIARNIGLSEKITISDIQTPYYPTGLSNVHEAERLELEERLARLKAGAKPVRKGLLGGSKN